jgi:terminase small subunit-like protein
MDPNPPTLTNGMAVGATDRAEATSLFPQIQHAKQRAMLAAVAHCLSVTAACAQVGIARETHYQWVRQDPDYAEAVAEARQLGADWLEDVAIARATAGDKPSDVLLIFLLKAARPEKYRENQRRDERTDVSELLKAVLLELADRQQARDVTPEADWAPVPPGARPSNGQRPPLPAPPEW